MKTVSHLCDPTNLLESVQSSLPFVIHNDSLLVASKRSLCQFHLPEFSFIEEYSFEFQISAFGSNGSQIFVSFDTKALNNSGILAELDDNFGIARQIILEQPAHILKVYDTYVAVAFNKTARLYVDFNEIAQQNMEQRILSLVLNKDSLVVITAENACILTPESLDQLENNVVSSLFYKNALFISSKDNTLDCREDGKTINSRFPNRYFYDMRNFNNFLFAIGDDGEIVELDLLEKEDGLVFDKIHNIYVDGVKVKNIIQIETYKNNLLMQDYEMTFTLAPLQTAQLIDNSIYLRSTEQKTNSFGEILVLERFHNFIAFSGSSNKVFLLEEGEKMAQTYYGHSEVVTHVKSLNDYLITVSEDCIIIWKYEQWATLLESSSLFLETAQIDFSREMLIPKLKIELSEQKQVTAFDAIMSKTRYTLAFATEKQIHTFEFYKYIQGSDYLVIEPEFVLTTAHTDYINALMFKNHELLVSASADKSIALWNIAHVKKREQQQEYNIFDIFTGRANTKRLISIANDETCIQRISEVLNISKRAIWHLSTLNNLIVVACGDKHVRIVKIADDQLKVIKTLENFEFSVVKAFFLNEKQVIALQQPGILNIVDIGTGDFEYEINLKLFCQEGEDEYFIRQSFKGEQKAAESVEFGCFALLVTRELFMIGTSTGNILELYDDSEEFELAREEESVQKIQQLQLINQYLKGEDFKEALRLSCAERDSGLLEKCIMRCKAADALVRFNDFEIEDIYFAFETSLKWLRMAKHYENALFLLDSIMRSFKIAHFRELYGEKFAGEIANAVYCCQKHRERLCKESGQIDVI